MSNGDTGKVIDVGQFTDVIHDDKSDEPDAASLATRGVSRTSFTQMCVSIATASCRFTPFTPDTYDLVADLRVLKPAYDNGAQKSGIRVSVRGVCVRVVLFFSAQSSTAVTRA